MTKVSPIAEYLRINRAIPKHDKYGCHFISPEGLYLGLLKKTVVNNYRVITIETFGEGFKRMYNKSIAIGQRFAYVKNENSTLGVSIVPVKTYMRKIFVDLINKTSKVEDTERTLANKLDLIAIDDKFGIGLYDVEKPFIYKETITHDESKNLKRTQFKYNPN